MPGPFVGFESRNSIRIRTGKANIPSFQDSKEVMGHKSFTHDNSWPSKRSLSDKSVFIFVLILYVNILTDSISLNSA
jgi:hypothetical protein